jgi:hypothetical protein
MKTRLKRCAAWFAMAGVAGGGLWFFVPYLLNGHELICVAGLAATLAVVGGLAPAPKPPDKITD